MNERIVSALVGLVNTCSNNGKTENTDAIVLKALLHCFEDVDEAAIVSEIKKDKFTISPNCETCPTPCGNTSDYDMELFHKNKNLKALKEELLHETAFLAKRLDNSSIVDLPEEIYRAISYFSYELAEDSYKKLIELLKQMEG